MWINTLLEDGENHSLSSKRVITFLAFVLCAIAFLANLFWGFKIDQFIYESMMYVVLGGLGVIVAEKFTKKSKE
jgi:FtsH-binding integral membrane protein